MSSPFPGMDPYLEQANLWSNVHNSLIVALRDVLGPILRPRYYVAIEERTVQLTTEDISIAMRPDVSILSSSPTLREHNGGVMVAQPDTDVITVELPMPEEVRDIYLAIYDINNEQVVTVVELLSPTNKIAGIGREQYTRKRLMLLGTQTHLVEIDLLRSGQPMPMYGYDHNSIYSILISRAEQRPKATLMRFNLQQPIPSFRMPLQPGDIEPLVALNAMLHELYNRAGYDLRIDYRSDPPPPPLSPADAAWVRSVIRDT